MKRNREEIREKRVYDHRMDSSNGDLYELTRPVCRTVTSIEIDLVKNDVTRVSVASTFPLDIKARITSQGPTSPHSTHKHDFRY